MLSIRDTKRLFAKLRDTISLTETLDGNDMGFIRDALELAKIQKKERALLIRMKKKINDLRINPIETLDVDAKDQKGDTLLGSVVN